MRVVAKCEESLRTARAGRGQEQAVMAQASEKSQAWSSNFKRKKKNTMESLILAQNERWRRG